MKYSILFTLVLIFTIRGVSQNRGLKVGTRISLGQSDLRDNQFSGTGRLYIGIGATADYPFNNWLGLCSDIMFSKKGTLVQGEYQSNDILNTTYKYTENYKFYQAEIPLMAKVRIGNDKFAFKFFAGPSVGFNLISVSSRTYENDNYNNENGYMNRNINGMNIFEKNIVCGLGIEVKSNDNETFFMDIRNNTGVSPIGRINNQDVYTRYSALSIGWMF